MLQRVLRCFDTPRAIGPRDAVAGARPRRLQKKVSEFLRMISFRRALRNWTSFFTPLERYAAKMRSLYRGTSPD